jgi:hypothetical protein
MLNLPVVMPRFMLLYAGHPVIPARQVESNPDQINRSVITGSSACADDDNDEYAIPLGLAPMPQGEVSRRVRGDGVHRLAYHLPDVRVRQEQVVVDEPPAFC